ncbi:DNA-binding protein [Rhodococcus sp. HNM0569]|uniref:DNA-binding protein n=1 Tax=Rhodococcus sp. HNM0569 TaxID=2716340 RepID=UPI00146D5794|nr:DNA-binding protein [Rhodococcus sp. HNM0569]NLU82240.1 DNA-binding protein [Rhodococcus sp. HNM0569]
MSTDDPHTLTPPDASGARAEREYTGLFRIAERHGATAAQRARATHPEVLDPATAVRLVAGLTAGSIPLDDAEPDVDDDDVTAALTLVPKMRAETDQLEAVFLESARARGMTWQHIAFGLGLGSPQAARQRYERLVTRVRGSDRD